MVQNKGMINFCVNLLNQKTDLGVNEFFRSKPLILLGFIICILLIIEQILS
ncbi:hypothetical protein EV196_106133 [Mariniflexile fucanivorans]|uniref:Uncharacterized protein n=1 Tax=Mariniflexile fucanivorans TaxID=264023 RepID=A0A4R1RG29_9FLAO|nr:hypothetical protein EV196_106133 [Mariniflexile fucanivorans]